MPAVPKPLLNLAASYQTARARRRIRGGDDGHAVQAKALKALLPELAATARGRELGLKAEMDYRQFRHEVPLSDFEELTPWIHRIIDGEADVMWPGKPVAWVATAGTTTGHPRLLPVSAAMAEHVRRASFEMLLQGAARTADDGCLHGRHLMLAGRTSHPGAGGHFDMSTLAVSLWPDWYGKAYGVPALETLAIENWSEMLAATIEETRFHDVTVLSGKPPWLIEFARKLLDSMHEDRIRAVSLGAVWPNLRCIVHGGTSLTPYRHELGQLAGDGVVFHEIYHAAEGLFAAQDSARGLRLLSEQGIFFEFLPQDDGSRPPVGDIGSRAVPLAEVKTGVNYELIVTTPAGLVRHRVGDIVRFTTLKPPRLHVIGHTALQLNAFGEHLHERHLNDVLVSICTDHHWRIAQFHVAPLPTETELGKRQGRHEWWVELRADSRITPRGPVIATRIDNIMLRSHPRYAELRTQGVLGEPVVRLVMPGAFQYWMKHHRMWGGPHRLPRARSDRQIADSLARIVRFSAE